MLDVSLEAQHRSSEMTVKVMGLFTKKQRGLSDQYHNSHTKQMDLV